jgi:hypothetical protein
MLLFIYINTFLILAKFYGKLFYFEWAGFKMCFMEVKNFNECYILCELSYEYFRFKVVYSHYLLTYLLTHSMKHSAA